MLADFHGEAAGELTSAHTLDPVYRPFAAAHALVPTTPIAPGVTMPMRNLGLQKDHSAAIRLGVRGIDTADVYGDAQQREVGRAVRESGIPREDFFITTKIPCCPGLKFTNNSANCNYRRDPKATSNLYAKRSSPVHLHKS